MVYNLTMRITNRMPIPAVMDELARRIARCRIDSGFSQAELADKAGVGVGTVARLEDGHAVSSETLFRILRALAVQENLEVLLPDADFQPMDYGRYNHQPPQRVSRNRVSRIGKRNDRCDP